jgi:hypothetical protein
MARGWACASKDMSAFAAAGVARVGAGDVSRAEETRCAGIWSGQPGTGCVYIAWEGGGQCFFPSENHGNWAHEFLKSIHGGPPITLGLIPPAGAKGAFYYRVDNAP